MIWGTCLAHYPGPSKCPGACNSYSSSSRGLPPETLIAQAYNKLMEDQLYAGWPPESSAAIESLE